MGPPAFCSYMSQLVPPLEPDKMTNLCGESMPRGGESTQLEGRGCQCSVRGGGVDMTRGEGGVDVMRGEGGVDVV
jgi:hypothetical protein